MNELASRLLFSRLQVKTPAAATCIHVKAVAAAIITATGENICSGDMHPREKLLRLLSSRLQM